MTGETAEGAVRERTANRARQARRSLIAGHLCPFCPAQVSLDLIQGLYQHVMADLRAQGLSGLWSTSAYVNGP